MLSVVGSASARAQAEVALARVRSLPTGTPPVISARPGVIDAAALLDLAPNPELLGREALALIADLECAQGVALVVTSNGLPLEVLAQHGWSAKEARGIARATEPDKRLALGELRGRRFYLTVAPQPDIASRDALGGIRAFIDSAVALESYRREDRRQTSLMPFEPGGEPDFVFLSDEMLKIVEVARRIAAGNLPVLITGETGTGKEVIARLIHSASDRTEQPFVAFNCTGLPRDTAESQLFGHRRGSFTDARDDAPGIIRGADGGTLMLDEIGELDLSIQPKLLRFLDSGEVQPVGEPRPVSVDVRVIAATNVAIDTLVREGRFREDLFYRLNVVRLRIPPLRERREEIPPLVRHFLRRFAREMHRGGLDLSRDAQTCLLLYDWPGNVRQLAKRDPALRGDGGAGRHDYAVSAVARGPRGARPGPGRSGQCGACAAGPGRAGAPDRPAVVVGDRAAGARHDPPGYPESGRPGGHDRETARSFPEGALPEAAPPGYRHRGGQLVGDPFSSELLRARARITTHFRPPVHPAKVGAGPCLAGVEYCRYVPSLRLAGRAMTSGVFFQRRATAAGLPDPVDVDVVRQQRSPSPRDGAALEAQQRGDARVAGAQRPLIFLSKTGRSDPRSGWPVYIPFSATRSTPVSSDLASPAPASIPENPLDFRPPSPCVHWSVTAPKPVATNGWLMGQIISGFLGVALVLVPMRGCLGTDYVCTGEHDHDPALLQDARRAPSRKRHDDAG